MSLRRNLNGGATKPSGENLLRDVPAKKRAGLIMLADCGWAPREEALKVEIRRGLG